MDIDASGDGFTRKPRSFFTIAGVIYKLEKCAVNIDIFRLNNSNKKKERKTQPSVALTCSMLLLLLILFQLRNKMITVL